MLDFLKSEPAVIIGLCSALIAVATSFGVSLTADQVGAIMALVSIVASIITRQLVTPTSKIPPP